MYPIVDGGDLRKYHSAIPNIIFTLGLTPYELTLYVLLKRTAGDEGACWKKTDTLVKESGMSAGMVSKAKEGLKKPRPELNGKALIEVKEEKNRNGGKPTHVITVTDIWPENMAHFGRPISQDEQPISPHEIASSPHEQAISPDEIKKNSGEEEPREEGEEAGRTTFLPPWLDPKAWARWVVHRAEIGHAITLSQAQAQFRQLEKFRARGMPPAEVIEQSIAGGWQGLFELKGRANGNGAKPQTVRAGKQTYNDRANDALRELYQLE